MGKIKQDIIELFHIDSQLYKDIEQHEGRRSNHNSIMVFSLVAALAIGVMWVQSCFNELLVRHQTVYAVGSIAFLVVFFLNLLVGKYAPKLQLVLSYVAMSLCYLYGILLGTVSDKTMQSTTFFVLMLFIPTLFIDHAWRLCLQTIIMDSIFIFMVMHNKVGDVRSADISDGVIFGLVSLVSIIYLTRIKYKRYIVGRENEEMAITDRLTGARNRNCFESRYHANQTLDNLTGFTFLYLDANCLHEINDSQGHLAGDRMLQGVTKCIQEVFGFENTYRVGGDEFVVMYREKSEENVLKKLDTLKANIASHGYSMSSGYRMRRDGEELKEVLKEAEMMMYADKENFYEQTGKHRR